MKTNPTPGPQGLTDTSGTQVAEILSNRFRDEDWLAALAKGAVRSRIDVQNHLESDQVLPGDILHAIGEIDTHLAGPDPSVKDDIFAAHTNSDDAPMEVDAEAGMTMQPGPKLSSSRTGSPAEMGEDRTEYGDDDLKWKSA